MTIPESEEEFFKNMPPDVRAEVIDFAQFLIEKKKKEKGKKLSLSWAGKLSEFKGTYSSVQLQKKANDWRR